jgi:hypothetical protein
MRSVRLFMMLAGALLGGCSLDRVAHDPSCAAPDGATAVTRWVIDSPMGSETIRVRYHPLARQLGCSVVEGWLEDHGPYPVVLDTGAAGDVFVNGIHVRGNRLPVFEAQVAGQRAALCRVDQVRIGTMELRRPTCWYIPLERGRAGSQGVPPAPAQSLSQDGGRGRTPTAADRSVIIGLPALRELSYVLLDDVRQEAELSRTRRFEPNRPDHWSQYPLFVRHDAHGYPGLFVETTLAGHSLAAQLDTGSSRSLSITDRFWDQLAREFPGAGLRRGAVSYPYIGRLSCRCGILDSLDLGGRTLEGCEVLVFPDDSSLFTEARPLIGMGCFRQTVIVLDFARLILWVANGTTAS